LHERSMAQGLMWSFALGRSFTPLLVLFISSSTGAGLSSCSDR
jgi:hypothetical protein